jgi:hypothetical protein
MPIIFRKSAKGVAEIETRANRLAPRMRSMLILVDGKRDAEDLKAMLTAQADETLQALAEQGFIEAVGETMRAPAPVPAAARPPAAPARPSADFDAQRKAAVRALNEALGPSAESLAIRIEKARTPEELAPLLAQGAKLVQAARGQAAGEAFADRFPAA